MNAVEKRKLKKRKKGKSEEIRRRNRCRTNPDL